METDIRYYRRRAYEEMSAASRAVTEAARERRLYLVGIYLDRLKALDAPCPFDERQLAEMQHEIRQSIPRSPFCWASRNLESETA